MAELKFFQRWSSSPCTSVRLHFTKWKRWRNAFLFCSCFHRYWLLPYWNLILLFSYFLSFPVTNTAKAGIIFPVSRLRRHMQEGRYAKIVRVGSAVYLAAALEYLVAEVLELSGNAARDNKRQRIIPRHIMMAVRTDSELDQLFKNVTIANGGVIPLIHNVLLPKNTKQTSQKSASEEMWKKYHPKKMHRLH